MNTKTNLITLFLLAACLRGLPQNVYVSNSAELVVSGTSTLHDWDMRSVNATCTATFTSDNAGKLTGLTALSFSTPAGGLKSDHAAMDNNAWKALKNSKNPTITYTMSTATVTPGENNAYAVKIAGKLTIAGTTRDMELLATVKLNADHTMTVTGSRAISMKDFNMQPPSFMLGAVKTGNDVTLKFTLVMKK